MGWWNNRLTSPFTDPWQGGLKKKEHSLLPDSLMETSLLPVLTQWSGCWPDKFNTRHVSSATTGTHKVTLRPVWCIVWSQHKGRWQRGNVFHLSSLSIFFPLLYLPPLSPLCLQNFLFSHSPCRWMTFSSPPRWLCIWLSVSTPSSPSHTVSLWCCQS